MGFAKLALLFVAGWAGGCATAQAARAPHGAIKHVVILTIDGLLPATYLAPDRHGLEVPTLRRMAAAGATADPGATSVFPSITYPAHTSIATGVRPGRHHITSNLAADPMRQNQDGWNWYYEDIRHITLYDLAFQAGYPTALIDWPVTVGARATDLLPEYWRAGAADDVKLSRALATPGFFDEIVKTYPGFSKEFTPPRVQDAATIDAVLTAFRRHAPVLTFAHIWQTDDAQHAFGPWSREAVEAINNADAQVARLIGGLQAAGVWESTVLVLLSDHGFAAIENVVRPNEILRELGYLEVGAKDEIHGWKAFTVIGGASAYVYLKDPNDSAVLAAAFAKSPGIGRVYDRAAIAALGGDPTAALALEAAPGYGFARGFGSLAVGRANDRGTHGYNPENPEMRTSMIFYGPHVQPGRLVGARLIDVAPTVAGWLGLTLPDVDGRPLDVKLR